MSSPRCVVCGHVNRAGAEVCELCDARLGAGAPGVAAAPAETRGEETRAGALPTDIPSPHFKGVGDVISPTLGVYRRHFPVIGLLVLVTTLPLVALQYGFFRFLSLTGPVEVTDEGIGGNLSLFALMSVSGGLASLLSMAAMALLSGALAYAVVELQRTGRAGVGDALRWGLKMLPKVFVVNLLYTLTTFLGFLLLIVPGIIFSLMFALVVPVAAIENRGVFESFHRSAQLTNGYKGLIFLTQFLWGLLALVVGMIVTGSFAFGNEGAAPAVSLFLQSLVEQLLQSTTVVLTVFIFLGILNEGRHGFDNRVITPPPAPGEEAAAR